MNIHNKNNKIFLFERLDSGQLVISEDDTFYPYYFEESKDGEYTGYDGNKLRKIICTDPSDVAKRRSESSYESDILFTKRYILDKIPVFTKTMLKYLFIDIEILADELPDTTKAKYPVSCVTIYNSLYKELRTWFLGDYGASGESLMLDQVVEYIKEESPDFLAAWNVNFDYGYLYNRISNFSNRISPIGQSRMGKEKCYYPAGISIVDFMGLYSKLTLNKRASYALDYIAQEDLGETGWEDTDFGTLNDHMKQKNINDVQRMLKLEEKFRILDHFDEIRRFSRCLWEDLPQEIIKDKGKLEKRSNNSKIIDMILLKEAKELGIILPKKSESEKEDYEGAYRDSLDTGAFFNVGKYDLGSAYPTMIADFCLDPQNQGKGLRIEIFSREENKLTETYYFEQNSDTLLPRAVGKLIKLKDELKLRVKIDPDKQQQYDAIKSIVNSCYGVMGNRFFRVYSKEVAETTTFLVRELLMFVRDKLEEKGFEVLYLDTDSVMLIDGGKDISNLLNNLIQDWAKKYNKTSSITFAYEYHFDKLLLLAKCHYYGIIKGKNKPEIKGIEVKRTSSSKFESKFQEELINKILNKESEESILNWLKKEREKFETLSIDEIAFPCKIISDDYKNVPVSVRAYNNSKELFPKFKIGKSELFKYLYIKPIGHDKDGKPRDVIAISPKYDISTKKHLINVNWNEMAMRNIYNKAEKIFEVMKWQSPTNFLNGKISLW